MIGSSRTGFAFLKPSLKAIEAASLNASSEVIQNYINAKTRNMYNMIDVNVYQENIFHTKMMLKEFDLDNYLFGITESELSEREIKQIKHQLKQEMMEIFYGRNLPSVKA